MDDQVIRLRLQVTGQETIDGLRKSTENYKTLLAALTEQFNKGEIDAAAFQKQQASLTSEYGKQAKLLNELTAAQQSQGAALKSAMADFAAEADKHNAALIAEKRAAEQAAEAMQRQAQAEEKAAQEARELASAMNLLGKDVYELADATRRVEKENIDAAGTYELLDAKLKAVDASLKKVAADQRVAADPVVTSRVAQISAGVAGYRQNLIGLSYAMNDAFSVQGNLSQRINAMANNLPMLLAGFGGLGVALSALAPVAAMVINNWSDLTGAFEENSKALEKQQDRIDKVTEAFRKLGEIKTPVEQESGRKVTAILGDDAKNKVLNQQLLDSALNGRAQDPRVTELLRKRDEAAALRKAVAADPSGHEDFSVAGLDAEIEQFNQKMNKILFETKVNEQEKIVGLFDKARDGDEKAQLALATRLRKAGRGDVADQIVAATPGRVEEDRQQKKDREARAKAAKAKAEAEERTANEVAGKTSTATLLDEESAVRAVGLRGSGKAADDQVQELKIWVVEKLKDMGKTDQEAALGAVELVKRAFGKADMEIGEARMQGLQGKDAQEYADLTVQAELRKARAAQAAAREAAKQDRQEAKEDKAEDKIRKEFAKQQAAMDAMAGAAENKLGKDVANKVSAAGNLDEQAAVRAVQVRAAGGDQARGETQMIAMLQRALRQRGFNAQEAGSGAQELARRAFEKADVQLGEAVAVNRQNLATSGMGVQVMGQFSNELAQQNAQQQVMWQAMQQLFRASQQRQQTRLNRGGR